MSTDPRLAERVVLIMNGRELEALLEVLAAVEQANPNLELSFRSPESGPAWNTLRDKICALVGPNGETTAPGGSGRLH